MIEAALNQQGVALVRIQLIQDEIRSGALIQPFDVSIRCDGAYYLVYEKAAERRDAFRKFREFLFSEVSTTARAAVGA